MIEKSEERSKRTIEDTMKTIACQSGLKFYKVNDHHYWIQDEDHIFGLVYKDGDIRVDYKYLHEDEYLAIDDLFLLPAQKVSYLSWRLDERGFHLYLEGKGHFWLVYYPRTKTLEISPKKKNSRILMRHGTHAALDESMCRY